MSKQFEVGEHYLNMIILGKEKNVVYGTKRRYICKCEYGKIHYIFANNLKNAKSCGCVRRGMKGQKNPSYKHGESHTSKLYSVLRGMKRRCYDNKSKDYSSYGGRGIKVCKEWVGEDGYINFKKWALENGYKEGLTIDRIDVNGNYEPSNCRWTTAIEQCNNRRNNVRLTYNGESKTIAEWSRELNIPSSTLYCRRSKGWNVENILFYKTNG